LEVYEMCAIIVYKLVLVQGKLFSFLQLKTQTSGLIPNSKDQAR